MSGIRIALCAVSIALVASLPAWSEESDGLPQESDGLGQQSDCPGGESECPEQESDCPGGVCPGEESEGGGSGSDCVCPKEGHWDMPNLEGSFKCKGAAMFNRKLKKHMKYGTTVMMKDDCTVIFGDGIKKKDEEGLMSRTEGCGYQGVIQGSEEGVTVDFDVVWEIHSQEHITGVMSGAVKDKGFSCEVYRPFEMDWTKPLTDAEREREIKEGHELAERMQKRESKK